ncbi:MAG: nitrous oxide reductase family maturation protein NosD [Bacteroidales bacterium]
MKNLLIKAGLFIIALCLSTAISAKTIEVCKNCEINTVKKAVELAERGDVIIVKKGLYQEIEILVDKPLIIKGEPGAILDGQMISEIIVIRSDSVTLDGLEFHNVGTSNLRDYAAVRVRGSRHFTIKNLIIRQPFFGIYLEKSSYGKVYNNQIYGNAVSEFYAGNGIHLWYAHYIEIFNNTIYQVRDGIYLEFSNNCTIGNNVSKNNVRYGLHFMFSNNDIVRNDRYENNGAGIAIMFSKDMEASDNYFMDNWGSAVYGMLLKEVYDAKITNNIFLRNTAGIFVEGCSRILYEYNDFESNGWAIYSRGANYENNFTNNNFISNSFDIAYTGSLNQNVFNGNYWSDYNGYDLDKDDIGDIPYKPVKLFSNLVNRSPEAIILLRSIFVDLVEFAEKVSPTITPNILQDETPRMRMITHDRN